MKTHAVCLSPPYVPLYGTQVELGILVTYFDVHVHFQWYVAAWKTWSTGPTLGWLRFTSTPTGSIDRKGSCSKWTLWIHNRVGSTLWTGLGFPPARRTALCIFPPNAAYDKGRAIFFLLAGSDCSARFSNALPGLRISRTFGDKPYGQVAIYVFWINQSGMTSFPDGSITRFLWDRGKWRHPLSRQRWTFALCDMEPKYLSTWRSDTKQDWPQKCWGFFWLWACTHVKLDSGVTCQMWLTTNGYLAKRCSRDGGTSDGRANVDVIRR